MSKQIKLPSGASVTLRDPKTFKIKDRKRIMRSADIEGGDLTKALALSDALIGLLIEDWSFDLIIPSVKAESLDELDPADYDFLVDKTKEAQSYLFPNLNKTLENEKDPKAPTDNLND